MSCPSSRAFAISSAAPACAWTRTSEINEELNGIKDETVRLHQIDQAIATEREPWQILH